VNVLPIVSVVVPVYQQQAFVAEAVESLLSQTLTDIEIIVVDDGSTDDSASIVESFSDPRLVLIRRPNGGPSVAINDGMLRAGGDFIALLGGDDVAEPWRLAHQVEVMAQRGIDIIFSEPTLIDREGMVLQDAVVPNFYSHAGHRGAPSIFRQLILDGNFLCAPTVMFRRSVFEEIGLFRPELIQLQDYEYWMRAAAAGKVISVMQRRTTRYRRHAGNLSSASADDTMTAEMMVCLHRALADAPALMIAEAFPEMMQPGQRAATRVDRALIAVAHRLAPALSNVFLLRAFLSGDAADPDDTLLMARLSDLPLPVFSAGRTILKSGIRSVSAESAEEAMWMPARKKSN
jgi:hypothetical protein